jgi:phospholipase C
VRIFITLVTLLALFGCSTQSAQFAPPSANNSAMRPAKASLPINHIVVIVQENRTLNNLFNGFSGAYTVTQGQNSYGQTIQLQPSDLAGKFDLAHRHHAWVNDYDGGKMNGFNLESENCYSKRGDCPPSDVAAYGYVPKSEVQPYWDMAEQYTLADEMFESSQGPSFPAHQYLISGTSAISNSSTYKASENAGDEDDVGHQGGCDSIPSTTVMTIDPNGDEYYTVYPCFERKSIMDLLNKQYVSWHYYQAFGGSGQWHAVDAIKQIWDGPTYTKNVRWPSKRVLQDIKDDNLASVVYVTPTAEESDHPGKNNGSGPSWVASIVNTIGQSKYWKSTAIIVVWDDWGGWYDPVAPKVYDSFELSFRVPMLVISPYAKSGYVSHTVYEFGSILKFIEETFNLPSLGTTDKRANDLSDCFNYNAKPRAFKLIRAPYPAKYFLDRPPDYRPPDDDSF